MSKEETFTEQKIEIIPDSIKVENLIKDQLAAAVEIVLTSKDSVTLQVYLNHDGKWKKNKAKRLKVGEKVLIVSHQTSLIKK